MTFVPVRFFVFSIIWIGNNKFQVRNTVVRAGIDVNPTGELALLRCAFAGLIDASLALGRDAELRGFDELRSDQPLGLGALQHGERAALDLVGLEAAEAKPVARRGDDREGRQAVRHDAQVHACRPLALSLGKLLLPR